MNGYAKVRHISCRDDGRVLISLTVGNASGSEDIEFLILDELFDELYKELQAEEIDSEIVERLDFCAAVTAAFSSACASLAFTQGSARALLRKLIAKGFSKAASEAAVGIAVERGYIDESAVARRRAEIMVSKLWGRSRILLKLREEGFSDSAMEEARSYLEDVDFVDGCMRAIKKKYSPIPTERKERDEMYASLMRLGYSSSDVKEALRCLKNEE